MFIGIRMMTSWLLCAGMAALLWPYSVHARAHRKGRRHRHSVQVASLNATSSILKTTHSVDSKVDLDLSFKPWSSWSRCSRKCKQTRVRKCKESVNCDGAVLKERRKCWWGSAKCSLRGRKGRVSERNRAQNRNRAADRNRASGGKKETDRNRVSEENRASGNKASDRRIEEFVYDLLYHDWSKWSPCTRSCKMRRYRTCDLMRWCRNTVLLEEKRCYIPGTDCVKPVTPTTTKLPPRPLKPKHESNKAQKEESKEKYDQKNPPTRPPLKYDPNACGLRNVTGSLRIVGGRTSRRGAWPWQVAVMTRWKEQYCGGALISPQYVLTAAHCVRKKGRKRRVLVRVGEYDLGEFEGTEEDIRIANDYVHVKFDIDTIDSDIAVLKLKTPVPAKKNIGFACLPDPKDVLPPKTVCYVIGWGKMKDTHIFGTDQLREAPVPLVSNEQCQLAFDYDITSNQMCAGYRRGGIDTCAGDSGGPLMCQINKKGVSRWYVYGVTSFGEGCGDKGKYGIYTKVTNFSKWIKSLTKIG